MDTKSSVHNLKSINHVIYIIPGDCSFHHMLGYMTSMPKTKLIGSVGTHDILRHNSEDIKYIHKRSKSDDNNSTKLIPNAFVEVQKNKISVKAILSEYSLNGIDTILTSLLNTPVKRNIYPIYHFLAENYTICNRWFTCISSTNDKSSKNFVNTTHNYNSDIHSKTSLPNNKYKPKKYEYIYVPSKHLINSSEIFNNLHNAGISWKIYYDDSHMTQSIPNVLNCNINKDTSLIDDIIASRLPAFSYVPMNNYSTCTDKMFNYDNHTEMCIGNIYNELIKSPLWKDTIIFIVHDTNGGFYDPIIPPYSNGRYDSDTEDRLGIRVPAIIVSPYTYKGGIDSTIYDHTSILKFLEARWNLQPLMNATSTLDIFNISNSVYDSQLSYPSIKSTMLEISNSVDLKEKTDTDNSDADDLTCCCFKFPRHNYYH